MGSLIENDTIVLNRNTAPVKVKKKKVSSVAPYTDHYYQISRKWTCLIELAKCWVSNVTEKHESTFLANLIHIEIRDFRKTPFNIEKNTHLTFFSIFIIFHFLKKKKV